MLVANWPRALVFMALAGTPAESSTWTIAPSTNLPAGSVVIPTIRLGERGGTGRLIDLSLVVALVWGAGVAAMGAAEKMRLSGTNDSCGFSDFTTGLSTTVGWTEGITIGVALVGGGATVSSTALSLRTVTPGLSKIISGLGDGLTGVDGIVVKIELRALSCEFSPSL